jgi:NAD-dependent DNA ligase
VDSIKTANNMADDTSIWTTSSSFPTDGCVHRNAGAAGTASSLMRRTRRWEIALKYASQRRLLKANNLDSADFINVGKS